MLYENLFQFGFVSMNTYMSYIWYLFARYIRITILTFESVKVIITCEIVANQDYPCGTFITGDSEVITAFIFASFLLRLVRNKNLIFATSQKFQKGKKKYWTRIWCMFFPLLWLIVFWALITKFGYFIYFLTASLFLEFILERTNILMTKQFLFATFGRDILSHYSFVFFVQTFFLKFRRLSLPRMQKEEIFLGLYKPFKIIKYEIG